ncbi:hypothetical protein Skr01_51550 [Sphaerisporangium krabiense]|nr:hypothetical protein Skr01_51550 [Sphaerisporangium krabiense]
MIAEGIAMVRTPARDLGGPTINYQGDGVSAAARAAAGSARPGVRRGRRSRPAAGTRAAHRPEHPPYPRDPPHQGAPSPVLRVTSGHGLKGAPRAQLSPRDTSSGRCYKSSRAPAHLYSDLGRLPALISRCPGFAPSGSIDQVE